MPNRRLDGGRPVTSSPSTRMRPRSGDSKPAIRRRAVVLPLPLGPSSAITSPFSISRESSRRTWLPAKLLSSRSRTRKGMATSALAADGAVPGGHPLLAVLLDEAPVDRRGLPVADHFLGPLRQLLGRHVGA